ncbi:MAG: type II toxin-antitoxin system VapC family toxin [Candidatus Brocadiales bacterium]|jgi:PIN domain nuclease of toxin-antitoxin system|nr:type II toxin-antitoxin system VapC family toxin [Candidatus Brocadiales bacterium]
MEITLDTHAFIWYLDKSLNNKLSPKALKAIKEAEDSYTVYLPIIVLMEVLYLIEKGRVNLSFHKLLLNLEESVNYEIVPFDTRLLKIAETIKGLEVHDRLILATAILTGSPLVSSDKEIHAKGIKVVW